MSALLLTAMLVLGPSSIYDFSLPNIEGKETPLKKYQGKVLLVVNVASKCGLTPQYESLEKAYRQKSRRGLVVLGFPANNFAGQEPGSNVQIAEFCRSNYGVTFPMFSKVSVKGEDQTPLYKWLIENSDRPKDDIEWNFAKFLVGRDGKVLKRFAPNKTVDDPEVAAAIDAALKPAPRKP